MDNQDCTLIIRNRKGDITAKKITSEQLEKIAFGTKHDLDNISSLLIEPKWTQFFEDGKLLYEGFAHGEKAFGTGKVYYPNGQPMAEGIFGIKGLLLGREYYPNGIIRFEGSFILNRAYGPNYPDYGTWYSDKGKPLFQGKFEIHRSSLGYPMISKPEGFTWFKKSCVKDHTFLWNDLRKYIRTEDWQKKQNTIDTLKNILRDKGDENQPEK